MDVRAEGLLPHLHARPGLEFWHCNEDVMTIGEAASDKKASLQKLPSLTASMMPGGMFLHVQNKCWLS